MLKSKVLLSLLFIVIAECSLKAVSAARKKTLPDSIEMVRGNSRQDNRHINKRGFSNDTIDLKGDWLFRKDPKDIGINDRWFSKSFAEHVHLPGSMTSNRKGDQISLSTPWTGSIVDSSYWEQVISVERV